MNSKNDQYADLHPSGYDYLLTAIAGALTSYAAGVSVASSTIGWIFVVASGLGVWISYSVMRAIRGSKLVAWNGFIYTGGIIGAFFAAPSLVQMLPDNPFKAQIFVCGLLLWMLAFGSYLIWSDQTLLFQSVPTIAIFGLVGCYDTYKDAVWLFFGFLLCFAAMLARVHGRTMLRQAKESGYSQTGERMDRSATELERMRSGPWKWVAGPQWALGSAFVVILFSFVGAPIIRQSVQGVAGAVRVNAPAIGRNAPNPASTNFDSANMRVGTGPNQLSDLKLFRATLDSPRYMRTNIYQTYLASGWQALAANFVGDKTNLVLSRSNGRGAITEIKNPKTIEFEVEPLTSRLNVVPIPGEIVRLDPEDATSIRMDATATIPLTGNTNLFKGRSIVSDSDQLPTDAVGEMPVGQESLTATTNIQPSVFELANRVATQGKTDFERARLIKEEIERRAKYNLNAGATPTNRDPVDYFLFDSKEGYCDLFASSMVLMARSVGIPARMVVGYAPLRREQDEDGRYIVTESERHAWAELFFKGHGWVVFDATEGAEEVPGGERGASNVTPTAQSKAIRLAIDVLIGFGVLLIAGFSIRSALKGVKLGPSRSDLDKEYLRFADTLARASGKSRNFDQTPSEYVHEALASLNGQGQAALAINAKFERHFYSPTIPDRAILKQLRLEVNALRASIKKGPSKVA